MMKWLRITLCLGSTAWALPLYNPAQATLLPDGVICTPKPINYCDPWDNISLNIGYTGSYVNQHPMVADLTNNQDDIRDFSLRTNASYLALNICDLFELFSTLGSTEINTAFPPQALNKPNSSTKIDLEFSTAYSVTFGGRWTAWQNERVYFGLNVNYMHTKPRVISVGTTQLSQLNYKYSEWQLGGGASYMIPLGAMQFVPYMGVHYSRSYFDAHQRTFVDPDGDTLTLISLRQLHKVGYTIGTTLIASQKMQLTAEAAFKSETAFTFNSSFRF